MWWKTEIKLIQFDLRTLSLEYNCFCGAYVWPAKEQKPKFQFGRAHTISKSKQESIRSGKFDLGQNFLICSSQIWNIRKAPPWKTLFSEILKNILIKPPDCLCASHKLRTKMFLNSLACTLFYTTINGPVKTKIRTNFSLYFYLMHSL